MCFLAHAYFSRVHQHLFCAEYSYMCRCDFLHQQLCGSLFWTILKGFGNAGIKSDSITWFSSSHGTPTASSSLFLGSAPVLSTSCRASIFSRAKVHLCFSFWFFFFMWWSDLNGLFGLRLGALHLELVDQISVGGGSEESWVTVLFHENIDAVLGHIEARC